MTFKPTPIHLPLLKSALPYKQECIELNKKILQYVTAVNINPSGRSVVNDYHNLREIIRIVMNNYKELQNECYCQVLKVMTGSNQLYSSSYLYNLSNSCCCLGHSSCSLWYDCSYRKFNVSYHY